MSTQTAAPPVTGRLLIAGDWQTPPGANFESHNPARLQPAKPLAPPRASVASRDCAARRRRACGWR